MCVCVYACVCVCSEIPKTMPSATIIESFKCLNSSKLNPLGKTFTDEQMKDSDATKEYYNVLCGNYLCWVGILDIL